MTNKEKVQKLQELEGVIRMASLMRGGEPSLRASCNALLYRCFEIQSRLGEGLSDEELTKAYSNPARFSVELGDFKSELVSIEKDQAQIRITGWYQFHTHRPEV